jgi:hypothetical protein
MPKEYPNSGPKKQGSKKDTKKDPGAEHRKPHNAGEALVSLTTKPQGATREGAYASDGNQNNGLIPTENPWRQPIVQPQHMPPRVPALDLRHFARGAHVQPQQIPAWNPTTPG